MGDRSNIVIQDMDGSRIWLYGHWMGADAITIVREVLTRADRLGDAPYLARIVFSRMVRDDIEGELGFGISTKEQDANNPHIILEPHTGTAWLESHYGDDFTTSPVKFSHFARACEESGENYDFLALVLSQVSV